MEYINNYLQQKYNFVSKTPIAMYKSKDEKKNDKDEYLLLSRGYVIFRNKEVVKRIKYRKFLNAFANCLETIKPSF